MIDMHGHPGATASFDFSVGLHVNGRGSLRCIEEFVEAHHSPPLLFMSVDPPLIKRQQGSQNPHCGDGRLPGVMLTSRCLLI